MRSLSALIAVLQFCFFSTMTLAHRRVDRSHLESSEVPILADALVLRRLLYAWVWFTPATKRCGGSFVFASFPGIPLRVQAVAIPRMLACRRWMKNDRMAELSAFHVELHGRLMGLPVTMGPSFKARQLNVLGEKQLRLASLLGSAC